MPRIDLTVLLDSGNREGYDCSLVRTIEVPFPPSAGLTLLFHGDRENGGKQELHFLLDEITYDVAAGKLAAVIQEDVEDKGDVAQRVKAWESAGFVREDL